MANFRALILKAGITTGIKSSVPDSLYVGSGILTESGDLTITPFGTNMTLAASKTFTTSGASVFDWSGSTGAFDTSSGAVGINGDATLAAGKDLTAAAGAGNLDFSASTGTFDTGTGLVGINGDTTLAAGKDFTAAVGAGVFDFSGATGAFSTSTGANTLSGHTTVAAGMNLSAAAGAGNLNWASSTGTFDTGTGAVGLNGDVTLAAGKDFTGAAGAGLMDLSAMTGTFDTPTGLATFNGSNNVFTNQVSANGGVGRSVAGALAIGTDASSTSVDISKIGELTTVKGDFQVDGAETIVGISTFQSDATFEGDTTIGNATSDDLVVTARLASHLIPKTNNTYDLGDNTTPLRFRSVFAQTSLVANNGTDSVTLAPTSVVGTGVMTLTAGAGSTWSTTAGALTLTSAIAATWSTAAGILTLNGTGGITFQGGATPALTVNATGTSITVQSGATLDTTGTGMIDLPALFEIATVAVGATVTAANLDTLTDGSNADALHVHAAAAATVVDIPLTAGEAISAGAPVAMGNDGGTAKVYLADADHATDERRNVIGIAADSAAANGDPISVRVSGVATVSFTGAVAAADVGKRIYLSPTVGTGSLTAPSASGDSVLRLGHLRSTTQIVLAIGERVDI